jgi:hypothetical protein
LKPGLPLIRISISGRERLRERMRPKSHKLADVVFQLLGIHGFLFHPRRATQLRAYGGCLVQFDLEDGASFTDAERRRMSRSKRLVGSQGCWR